MFLLFLVLLIFPPNNYKNLLLQTKTKTNTIKTHTEVRDYKKNTKNRATL
ncbi:hypothetical protein HanXRQr2_Chr17g0808441 [Helianthus annuus]|uniref:Uncharacterized protein n=1 Tax=Helianthus annuus TaxID=4232 RepID=A0A9K3DKN8_HELAN|nr:hypothetical protein HanXRQr2_Chr17g0808441 [Helianthus annuus]